MDEKQWLARRFEEQRPRLRAVAYRMLGSLAESEDAVQEAWVRVSRSDASAVENLEGWLTTVVARVSLNMLRSRRARRETPMDVHLPDPIIDRAGGSDPEHEALVAVLDPDVVLRADGGTALPSQVIRGAETVAAQALLWEQVGQAYARVRINGTAGVVAFRDHRAFAVGTFTIRGGKISELDILADPERLARLDAVAVWAGGSAREGPGAKG